MLLDIQSKEELSVNLSITNACNRRCAYCFQKDWYLSKKANAFTDESVREMPLEEFEKLCTWVGKRNKTLKLLGGEPLLYSKLPELLDIAEKAKKKIVFISNISVEEPLFDRIYDRLSCDKPNVVSFLINTDYPASQEEIFMRNLRLLCKTKLSLGFSTTLLPGQKEIEKSRIRIEKYAQVYKEVRGNILGFHVRLAPLCPNPTNSTGFHIYNFTQDLVEFVNSLAPTQILEYGFDCPVNLCELNSDFLDACRNMGVRFKIERCSPENGMPFDVLVDHSVIWCSSANFIRLNDWRDYTNYDTALVELSSRYYAWWREHGESEKCRACNKHNPGFCSGFCIAKTKNLSLETRSIPIVADKN